MRTDEVMRNGFARLRARVPWYAFVAFAVIFIVAAITVTGDAEISRLVAPIGLFAGSTAAGFRGSS